MPIIPIDVNIKQDAAIQINPVDVNVTNTIRDLVAGIQLTGQHEGSTAYVFNIVGRRHGFTSTSIPNDLKEFDTSAAFFTQLTGVEPLEIVSTSVNDTNAAGTGIRSVKVTYIDSSNNLAQSGVINLNGTTPVAAGFTANEILWMEAMSSGSLRVAQGNIVVRVVAGPVEIEQITQNSSKSKTGKFMVPAGYTGYLYMWDAQAVNNDQDMYILAQCDSFTRAFSSSYHIQDNIYVPINSLSPENHLGFLKVPELARVKMSTISAGTVSTVRASGSFLIIIIAN